MLLNLHNDLKRWILILFPLYRFGSIEDVPPWYLCVLLGFQVGISPGPSHPRPACSPDPSLAKEVILGNRKRNLKSEAVTLT